MSNLLVHPAKKIQLLTHSHLRGDYRNNSSSAAKADRVLSAVNEIVAKNNLFIITDHYIANHSYSDFQQTWSGLMLISDFKN